MGAPTRGASAMSSTLTRANSVCFPPSHAPKPAAECDVRDVALPDCTRGQGGVAFIPAVHHLRKRKRAVAAVSLQSPNSSSISTDQEGQGKNPAAAFGPNEWLVDEIYQQYLQDPNSVDRAWWDFFADYKPGGATAPSQPAEAPAPAPVAPAHPRLRRPSRRPPPRPRPPPRQPRRSPQRVLRRPPRPLRPRLPRRRRPSRPRSPPPRTPRRMPRLRQDRRWSPCAAPRPPLRRT